MAVAEAVGGAYGGAGRHAAGRRSLAYYDISVTTLLIRGFDPLNNTIEYGREHTGAAGRDSETGPRTH